MTRHLIAAALATFGIIFSLLRVEGPLGWVIPTAGAVVLIQIILNGFSELADERLVNAPRTHVGRQRYSVAVRSPYNPLSEASRRQADQGYEAGQRAHRGPVGGVAPFVGDEERRYQSKDESGQDEDRHSALDEFQASPSRPTGAQASQGVPLPNESGDARRQAIGAELARCPVAVKSPSRYGSRDQYRHPTDERFDHVSAIGSSLALVEPHGSMSHLALGRALVAAAGAWLVLLGLVIAVNTPALSGGTIAGAVLILTGGGLVARMVHVAEKAARARERGDAQ